jgi:type IV pilus assembly protein PilY1
VDAFNGNVVWQASSAVASTSPGASPAKLNVPGMSCAIASDVAVVDINRDAARAADRVYVGDTCGQVWRLDISSSNMDNWAATRIANISTGVATDVANKRKFLFPPDLVFAVDGTGNYTAVLLGSGDREHPFDTNVVNRFYMLKDRDSADLLVGATNSTSVRIAGYGTAPTGSPYADADLFDATSVVVDATAPSAANGWKITLSAGEKVVSSAVTISGTTFFNTNQPSSTAGGGACGSNLGIAREYLVGFADAGATIDVNASGGITIADRSTIHAGGGYLPSPVPVVVEIDGKKYQAVISGTSVQSPPGLTLEKRTRSHWYKQVD